LSNEFYSKKYGIFILFNKTTSHSKGGNHVLIIKRFSELCFNEAISLWNESWNYYFVDMKMDLNRFLQKVTLENISLEDSVVAQYEGKLAGFVLNSFRTINGKNYAWNGGTAVVPEFRGMGIGKKLIAVTLEIYDERKVDVALLEAIQENAAGVRLYEKMGYEIFDELIFWKHDGILDGIGAAPTEITVSQSAVHEIKGLSFYNPLTAWQTQFTNDREFSCVTAYHEGTPIGYAVYKKNYTETGEIASIILYQSAVKPESKWGIEAARSLMNHVFVAKGHPCRRMTVNLPNDKGAVNQVLAEAGFTVFVEQFHMARAMKKDEQAESSKILAKKTENSVILIKG
jgi:GNAT superfamily N-acetyltransferase